MPSVSASERRQLTVVFCDLVGSVALSRQLDPEDWHQVVHIFHARCGAVVARRQGHVAQYLGDGLLAYFGYPVAAEDASRQAVAAGLEMLREVASIQLKGNDKLSLRIGIHTGPVIVGNIGSTEHREFLALGETPNVAARIQDAAPSDTVVISSETHRLVEGFFDAKALGAYRLKGFPQPVELYRVLSESGPQTRLEAAKVTGLTPLLGRDRELAALHNAWQSALSNAHAVLICSGEPGIGKSRLVLELMSSLPQPAAENTTQLRCAEYARSSAFHPLIEGVKRQAGIRSGESNQSIQDKLAAALGPLAFDEKQLALLASLLGVPLDAALAPAASELRASLLAVLKAWCTSRAAPGPKLLVVEDVHWADPSTLDVVSALVSDAGHEPLLMLFTARPEFEVPAAWQAAEPTVLRLKRLSESDTTKLVAHVAGDKALPPQVAERVLAEADGVPLFLEEITKAVLESGVLREADGKYELERSQSRPIPATLHDSLMGRLDLLGHSKPMAQLASVLGREFSFALFERMWEKLRPAPSNQLEEGLRRLVTAQLLSIAGTAPDVEYQFKHALLQEAAYQSLLKSMRREYHLAAAQVLAEDFPARVSLEPELVAHHYTLADQPSLATEYWDKAGGRAISASAYAEAITHFSEALSELNKTQESATRLRQEIDLRSRLGVALITTRGFSSDDVRVTYSRAAELCDELGDEIPIRVVYGTWAVNLVRSDLASTSRMLSMLERTAQRRDLVASGLVANAALGTWSFMRAEYTRCIEHCQTAISLREPEGQKEQHLALVGEHGFEGYLYPDIYLAWAYAITGQVAAARATWQQAHELADSIGDPYLMAGVLCFGAMMNHDLGDTAEARRLSQRARQLSEEKSFAAWLAVALVANGNTLIAERQLEEAIATIQQGLGLCNALGAKALYGFYLVCLTEAYLTKGDLADAERSLDEGLKMAHENVDCLFEPQLIRLKGEVRRAQGDHEAALELFSEAMSLAKRQGARLFELMAASSLARTLIDVGKSEQGLAALRPIRESFAGAAGLRPLQEADALLAG